MREGTKKGLCVVKWFRAVNQMTVIIRPTPSILEGSHIASVLIWRQSDQPFKCFRQNSSKNDKIFKSQKSVFEYRLDIRIFESTLTSLELTAESGSAGRLRFSQQNVRTRTGTHIVIGQWLLLFGYISISCFVSLKRKLW